MQEIRVDISGHNPNLPRIVIQSEFLDGNTTGVEPDIKKDRHFYDIKVEGVQGGTAKIEITTSGPPASRMQYFSSPDKKWVNAKSVTPAKTGGSISGSIDVVNLQRTPIVIGT